MRNRRPGIRPSLDQLDDRCLLSSDSPAAMSGLTPAQIDASYGLGTITFTSPSGSTVKGDGSGETIALIELNSDPDLQSDVNAFDARYNLPGATLTVMNLAGSQTDSDWSVEQALDAEWTHAVAPGANILVVEAAPAASATQELQNLLAAVNAARNTPGVAAISMSWGFGEMANESQYDSYFTTPTGHTGIAFIASSGDNGTAEYPATSPDVIGVGGTTLNLSGSGAYASEAAWADSGGGYSQFEPEPAYQESVQKTGRRSTPDVAFDGDPATGVPVYSTDPSSGQESWQVVAGTSLGAPVWAGIVAIVDQGRALAGKASMDGATQLLPSLYAAPATDFHTVTPSSSPAPTDGGFGEGVFNPFGTGVGVIGGTTTAGAAANTSTGLGSPFGSPLVGDLVASSLTVVLATTAPTAPGTASAPTEIKKLHAKHRTKTPAHTIKRTKTYSSTLHKGGLIKQGQSKRAKKLLVHRSRKS